MPDIGDVFSRIAAYEDSVGVTEVTSFSNEFVSYRIGYRAQLLVIRLA